MFWGTRNEFTDKIAKDMTKIFDYPVEDIVRRSKDGKKTNQNIVEDFYQAVRRHEKLFYDSFKCIRDLSEDDMLEIRKSFFSKVLDTGWRDKLIELGDKSKDKYSKYSSGLVLKDGCYILKTKFNINNSTLLGKAIKSGAEISDDELGYSSGEEEAVQIKDNQIGGARK